MALESDADLGGDTEEGGGGGASKGGGRDGGGGLLGITTISFLFSLSMEEEG